MTAARTSLRSGSISTASAALLVRDGDGNTKTSTAPEELLHWATRIAARYMGEDVAEKCGRRNAVPPEMVVRVTPLSIAAKVDVAD